MSEHTGTGREKPQFQLFPHPVLLPRITSFCASFSSPHPPFPNFLGFQRTEAPRPPGGKDLHGNSQPSPHPTPVGHDVGQPPIGSPLVLETGLTLLQALAEVHVI